ncbi:MAG: DMT family transporter [Saprospiraceae bacterium]|nr:DMT family transporter [Saprospiraceae bacterium]MCB9323284.1 DMT family transporter [Lewinellaceae bacterium]
MTKITEIKSLKYWFTLGLLGLVWGSSFILIKKGLTVYSPYQVGAIRLGVSALVFLPFFLLQARRVDWSKWKWLLLVGLCGSGIPAFLFPIAQMHISSSVSGVLNSLTPLFTLLLGLMFFGRKFRLMKLVGVFIGLVGATVLILAGNASELQGSNMWFSLVAVLATICYGTSVNTVGSHLSKLSSLTISAVSFVMIGFPALLFLFTTDFVEVLTVNEQGYEAFFYVVLLAIAGTVLASLLFFQLVHWTNPVFASSVAYIIPLIAMGWGMMDGETLSVFHFISAGMILYGLYLSRD